MISTVVIAIRGRKVRQIGKLTYVNGFKRVPSREMSDQVDRDNKLNDRRNGDIVNPIDCTLIPTKDLPNFLSELPEDTTASLRPPVPIGGIHFEHVEELIGERASRSLRHQLENVRFQSLRHQCYCLDQIVQADELIYLSRTACGKVLGLSRQQFHSFLDNYVEYLNNGDQKTVGRPKLITEDESKEIIDEIRRRQLMLQPMTITNICNFIYDKFHKACSRRFVRDWISRHKRDVMIQFVKPAEQARATVKHDDLRQFYTQLPELLKDTIPQLIYNVDETGFSRRCSATKLRAVLCTDSQPEKAVYVQKPDETTLTLLACVSLAGKHLRPYVILPTKSVNKEILAFARPNKECKLVFHPNGFSTHAVFFDWFREVFLPKIQSQRERMKCPDKKAVLIFDGFAGHESKELYSLAAENNIMLIKIPPHSSHLTQPLDQQVFQTLKAAYRRETSTGFIKDRMVRKLFKILKACGESFLPHIIRESWDRVGVQCRWNDEGEFTNISIEMDSVIRREVPVGPQTGELDKRKRMKLKAPFGPVNLDELKLVADDKCPLCHLPKNSTPLQSTLLSRESDIREIQESVVEKWEQKAMNGKHSRSGNANAVIEYLIEKGRVALSGRRHIESLRESLVEWKVLKIITAKCVDEMDGNEPAKLNLDTWTTSSKIAAQVKPQMRNFHYLPDLDDRIFRTLITLVTHGVLDKREPELGRGSSESEIPEFQFRLHVE